MQGGGFFSPPAVMDIFVQKSFGWVRRDPRHPKPKPGSFFMRQKAAKSVLAGFSKVGKYDLNELLTKIKNGMKNSN